MSDENNDPFELMAMQMGIGLYIEPSVPGLPPRGRIMIGAGRGEDDEAQVILAELPVVFNGDLGQWCHEGEPIKEEFGQALSEHAAELGVEGF